MKTFEKYMIHGLLLTYHILKVNIYQGCVRHQVESYNYFVNHQIQKTIDMFNPVTIHSEHDYLKRK